MLPSLSEKDLSKYFDKADLIRKTAEQLKKDMAQAGEEINLPATIASAYDELYVQVVPIIQKLVNSNYQKLLQLLYRIDVNEKQVAAAVNEEGDVAQGITRLILYRELQKVVIREYYSKG